MNTIEMQIPGLLSDLAGKDINVWLEGDRLRCNAPAGALTPEFRDLLRDRKSEIIAFLSMATAAVRQQPAIVPLQPHGALTPIYAVPGHVGVPFSFTDLSKHLGDNQPFFALQPPGFDEKSEPMERVEDIADYFASQILQFQPTGAYIIAGYCSGTATAFELARLLSQRGAEVRCVVLFGPLHPSTYQKLHRQMLFHAKSRAGALAWHMRQLAARPSMAERRQYIGDILRDRGKSLLARVTSVHEGNEADPVLQRRERVKATAITAIRRYTPTPYTGRVCMFLPNRAWIRSGASPLRWLQTAPQAEVYYGPKSCYGPLMLEDPNAPAIAELCRQSI
jgi:thioesterase domain-containing protein